jgi:hypothetical protein
MPAYHHHRLLLSLASLLTSPKTPRKVRRGCWRCWPGLLTPGTGAASATG